MINYYYKDKYTLKFIYLYLSEFIEDLPTSCTLPPRARLHQIPHQKKVRS